MPHYAPPANLPEASNHSADPGCTYHGTTIPYRTLQHTSGWASFFVDNRARSGRRRPLHPSTCSLCLALHAPSPTEDVQLIHYEGETYGVMPNNNPILDQQLLVFPVSLAPDTSAGHRLDLTVADIALALHLAHSGFTSLFVEPEPPCHPIPPPATQNEEILHSRWAVYVNAFPGSGRSVPHLHLNAVPAAQVPLLPAGSAPWQVCQDKRTGVVLSRMAQPHFYALLATGDSSIGLAETVARLHEAMNTWSIPYNLLAYPLFTGNTADPSSVQLVIVSRDQEYCAAVDQKLGGLEFLTGVLIPGVARLSSMDTIQRDMAFAQATLKGEACLAFERQLCGLFGLPPLGFAVYPTPQSTLSTSSTPETPTPYVPTVRPNTLLDDAHRCHHWIAPRTPVDLTFAQLRAEANVLVRVTRASICQSDRRVLSGMKDSALATASYALGHEAGGYIVDPGPWESEVQAGEKVVILPHLTCGQPTCDACRGYLQNLCPHMLHLGFHLHGTLADLMSFPLQCIFLVESHFPDDALPLVEPLACVLRALFRIKEHLTAAMRQTSASDPLLHSFVVCGAGPMGCLAARAVKRFWPELLVTMIDPILERRAMVQHGQLADTVTSAFPPDAQTRISFVASSQLQAAVDAVAATHHGGTVLLFSGINTDDLMTTDRSSHAQALILEDIHRKELSVQLDTPFGARRRLIGSSGYTFDDVKRSVRELCDHYDHYQKIQNVVIEGLTTTEATYRAPCDTTKSFPNAVEALLAPHGVHDPQNGAAIAAMTKVLIRL